MKTAKQKRQRRRRNQILDGILSGLPMAMPALLMLMWLGLGNIFMFIIELSR